jgi:transcription elongation factor Elf1
MARQQADNSQYRFNEAGQVVEPPATRWEITTNLDEPLRCPYCLSELPLHKFTKRTKSGKISQLCVCPVCNNGVRMRTLTTNMSIKDYAEWIVWYPFGAFWHKVPYDLWRRNLEQIIPYSEFLKYYYAAKSKYLS